jgi:hypothetical protein
MVELPFFVPAVLVVVDIVVGLRVREVQLRKLRLSGKFFKPIRSPHQVQCELCLLENCGVSMLERCKFDT